MKDQHKAASYLRHLEQRSIFINTAIKCAVVDFDDLEIMSEYLGRMYDAGFRLPESK